MVMIPCRVKSITSNTEIVLDSDEINYPTSTTARKELTVTPRICKMQ